MANQVMGKEKSEKDNIFAKGGSNAMSGQNTVGTQKPGVSSSEGQKSGSNKAGFNTGSAKDVGPQAADPQAPGVSGHSAGSSQKWGLPPSKGHMAGWTGAQPAKPA